MGRQGGGVMTDRKEQYECLVAELENDTGGINWYCVVHNIRWRTNAFEGRPVRCSIGEYAAKDGKDE